MAIFSNIVQGEWGDPYGGMLDDRDRRAAFKSALPMFGAALLGQGYSRVPQSGFEGIGQGIAQFQQARDRALRQSLERKLLDRQIGREDVKDARDTERFGMEKKTFERTDTEANRKLDAQRRLAKAIQESQATGRDLMMSPEVVSALADLDPGSALSLSMKGGTETPDIKEYQFAKQQGFNGTFQQWIAQKRQGAGEYGLNPIWGTDAQGNPSFIQPGKSGTAIQGKLPPGFNIARDPIKMDAGTEWILLDPQTRQPVGRVPKDLQGKEAAEARGKQQGEAQANLGSAMATADNALKVIQDIRNHPGKSMGLGVPGALPAVPGTAQAGFVDLVNQAKGQAFLQAFSSLKGGGAITEVEGQKATQAIARLERARRPEDFEQALNDLEAVINTGKEKLKQKAAGGATPNAAPKRLKFNPQTGELE